MIKYTKQDINDLNSFIIQPAYQYELPERSLTTFDILRYVKNNPSLQPKASGLCRIFEENHLDTIKLMPAYGLNPKYDILSHATSGILKFQEESLNYGVVILVMSDDKHYLKDKLY